MRQLFLSLGGLIAFGATAMSQEAAETPLMEAGFNYSYLRINPGGGLSSNNANGAFADVQVNLNRWASVAGDVGGYYLGTNDGVHFGNKGFEFLVGPRFTWRHSRLSPYVQALFGDERFSNGLNPAWIQMGQNSFAMALGGGLDIALTSRIAVRPFELDYVMIHFEPGEAIPNTSANNLRYSTGIIFRLGSK